MIRLHRAGCDFARGPMTRPHAQLAQAVESADNRDAHLNPAITAQGRPEHGDALLGKGQR